MSTIIALVNILTFPLWAPFALVWFLLRCVGELTQEFVTALGEIGGLMIGAGLMFWEWSGKGWFFKRP